MIPPSTPEDNEAWRQETQGTVPLSPAMQSRMPAAPPRPAGQSNAHFQPLSLAQLPPVAVKGPMPTFDATTLRGIRLGRIPIDRTLDLHGLTQAAAHEAFERCIYAAYADGCRLVLVITGKGRVSEAGVLRSALPEWCAQPPLRQMIIALRNAAPAHGGDGAYYVRIRKHVS